MRGYGREERGRGGPHGLCLASTMLRAGWCGGQGQRILGASVLKLTGLEAELRSLERLQVGPEGPALHPETHSGRNGEAGSRETQGGQQSSLTLPLSRSGTGN